MDESIEECFYIAFEECTAEEVEGFRKFLEEHSYLQFPDGTRTENIDNKEISFARIDFAEDFMERSEYVDRLKFQLPVKSEDKTRQTRNPSKESLLNDDHIEVQKSQADNCSDETIVGRARKFIQWVITSARGKRDILMKNKNTFEVRRDNIKLFNEEDLKSYLTRGTILQAILKDETNYELEYSLKDLKRKIIDASSEEILKILDDKDCKFIRFYNNKLIKEVKNIIRGSESDKKALECAQNLLDSEIFKYENYNSVRNKITILPMHRDLPPEHPLIKWISIKKSLGSQPLFEIKNYFGVKVATYFAWAGFYTYMLIIASIMGVICIIFGMTAVPYSKLSEDICKSDVIMCPRCDRWCDYWRLRDTCTHSILHHTIDNFATIIYTIFMSIWSVLYLRYWQRYIAQYNTNWDVINLDYSSQFSRSEYVKNVNKLYNHQNQKIYIDSAERRLYPKVEKKIKLYRTTFSFFICILWVLLSLGMVFALLLYRMSLITSEKLYGDRNSYSIYVVPISTALLDLAGIQVLNYIYGKIAVYLTEAELPRTETEYENSFSIKLFMFQFVNYYSAIFYIAIFKGKFIGTPARYTRVFGFRQEECNPGGCLVELAIQLGIIMTGRQAIKLVTPYIITLYQDCKRNFSPYSRNPQMKINLPDYMKNYNLKKFDFYTLMPEYLEMVIQFGFVTLFVAAFPLAPLFALLNNILEVRLDGRKFLKEYRRPMPSRVKGIGVWLKIMSLLTKIAAASNAVIIAFSTHFVSKLVYRMSYSQNHNFEGYLNHSLAVFNTEDFEPQSRPIHSDFANISKCYYLQYRNPPEEGEHKYKKYVVYWHMMAAKLTFIVVYQFFISLIVICVEYSIPSVPQKVKRQVKRHARFMLEMERELNTNNPLNSSFKA